MDQMERWKGKVALVTGASSGIGRATAVVLAREGMKVAVAARRLERLEALAKELEAGGAQVLPIQCDLEQHEDIHRMWDTVRKQWGGVDVLINNAGLGWGGATFNRTDREFQQMANVNLVAVAINTREAMKDMQKRDESYIIAISSMGGHRISGRGNTFYGGTKHGVCAFVEGVRMELAARESPIKVGLISPGTVATEIQAVGSRGKTDASKRAREPMEAEDIADMVRYMLACPPRVQIHDILVRPRFSAT